MYSAELEVAVRAASAAGRLIQEAFRVDKAVQQKANASDLVTQVLFIQVFIVHPCHLAHALEVLVDLLRPVCMAPGAVSPVIRRIQIRRSQ
jgi:hypothetical protein